MRRIPFIYIKNNKLFYICPHCKNIIPRDLYKQLDWCPSCDFMLNKTAKSIMKVYEILDKEFYGYFIYEYRGENKWSNIMYHLST